jgi:hypothetical protein
MRAIGLAIAVSVALVGSYLALGGASYAPAKVADPCVARNWRGPTGFQEVAQQIVLSVLDGAACKLGTSREAVVLAFEDRESLNRFASEHGLGLAELEALLRAGLLRAVSDAQRAGALNEDTADALRRVARTVPLTALVDLLEFLPRG